jgi:ADP-L-glycero-D-manno-heptose 6-epimerase
MTVDPKKIIVVTGGAGFIGSCLVRYLNDRGRENLVVVDDLQDEETWKNLVGKKFRDIIHKNDLSSWLGAHGDEVGAIFHLGACSATTETNVNYLLENNYRYTVRLATFAIERGVRFIYASSAATYGDGSAGFRDDHEELERLAPLNPYGWSKQLFDLWAKREGVLDKIVGLKYFNVYGPNEYHKGRMSSAIRRMVPDILARGSVTLFRSNDPDHFADGEQKRDFIYVKDAVRMTAAFLDNDASGIFNIGTGRATSWNALTGAIFSSLGREKKIIYADMPSDLAGKYQNFTEADMRKTSCALGSEAQITPMKEAVHDYVANYLVGGRRW